MTLAFVYQKFRDTKLTYRFPGKLQEILQYAVDQNAYYKQYPDDWLWKWRTEEAKAPDGSPVQTAKIGGRTTYFFDGYQKLFA